MLLSDDRSASSCGASTGGGVTWPRAHATRRSGAPKLAAYAECVHGAIALSTATGFRLVTFCLPQLWGSLAMRWLRKRAYV